MSAIPNSRMVKGRFLRLHIARQKLAFIRANLAAGRVVYLSTYTRHTKFSPRHLPDLDKFFRTTKTGLYVARGKNWDNCDGSAITAG